MSIYYFNNISGEIDDLPRLHTLNTSMWLSMDPHSIILDEVIPGFYVGTVGALVAPGGTGKSFLALELAMAVASPLADIASFNPVNHGRVLYLNAEDIYLEIGRRLAWLGERISPEAKEQLKDNLVIASATGALMDLSIKPDVAEKGITDIEQLVESFGGFRLIILDTLTRFHSLEENNNGQMSQLVSQLEYLAKHTGAAILFLHHTNKIAIREGSSDSQAASRGASSLVDNVRYAAYLTKMTTEEAPNYGVNPERSGYYLRFGVSKQNYGLSQTQRWFERKEGGVLVPIDLSSNPQAKRNKREID
jgi:RecA-family ATPase